MGDLDDVDVAWDLFQDVLKVHQICTRRNVPDPMDCGAAEFIPSADRIRACADSNHKKPWFTLREFLEFFTDPIHIELESDKVPYMLFCGGLLAGISKEWIVL